MTPTPFSLCFVNSNRAWGGGEKFNHDCALRCRDAGLPVHIVANRNSELSQRLRNTPGLSLHEMPLSNLSFLNPLTLGQLRLLFMRHNIQTVITALPADLKAAGIAARWAGVSRVVYRRGIAVPVRNSLLNRLLYGHVLDRLIVNSLETKRCVLANNPKLIPEERIRLVPNGFDVAAFDALPITTMTHRRPGELILGNAARLTPQKGQHHLLEMARLLKKQGLSFRLLIAGTGETENELKNLARRLDVEDVVEFLGFVEDMKSFHASLDIFVLSSLWEGFCYALAETMTLKNPVVAFDISSNPEVVENRVTGLLTTPDNAQGLAQAVLELANDSGKRTAMGQAGRMRVLERFDTPRVFDTFLDVVGVTP